MKEIPTRLQCAYCVRNQSHGGECRRNMFNDTGCLVFLPDPKGCIRNMDCRLPVPLYREIPPLNTLRDDWQIGGIGTEIRIVHIRALSWDSKKGYLIVHCNCDYYINEYHEDYKDPKDKPILKIVK